MTKDDIIAALPDLSADDLKAVHIALLAVNTKHVRELAARNWQEESVRLALAIRHPRHTLEA